MYRISYFDNESGLMREGIASRIADVDGESFWIGDIFYSGEDYMLYNIEEIEVMDEEQVLNPAGFADSEVVDDIVTTDGDEWGFGFTNAVAPAPTFAATGSHTHEFTGQFSAAVSEASTETVWSERNPSGRPMTLNEMDNEMYSLYEAARAAGDFQNAYYILNQLASQIRNPF